MTITLPTNVTIRDHQLRVRDMNVSMGRGLDESEQWIQGPGGPWVASLTMIVGINQWSAWQSFLDSLRGTAIPVLIDPGDLDPTYDKPAGSQTVNQAASQYASRVVLTGSGWAVNNMFNLGGVAYRVVSVADAVELVTDGTFENGLTEWTITSDAPAPDPSYDASTGLVTIDRQGGDSPTISQTITLSPGSTYTISAGISAGSIAVRNGGAFGATICTLTTASPSASVTSVTASSVFLTDANTGSGAGNRAEISSFSIKDTTTTDKDVTIVPRLRAAASVSDAVSAASISMRLASRDTGRLQKPAPGAGEASLELVEYFA